MTHTGPGPGPDPEPLQIGPPVTVNTTLSEFDSVEESASGLTLFPDGLY